jgi:hypothetical protein
MKETIVNLMDTFHVKLGLSVSVVLIWGSLGCNKATDAGLPTTELVSGTVYASNSTAIAALSGIYSRMMQDGGNGFAGGSGSVTFLTGLSSDELINYSSNAILSQYYQNALIASNSGAIWNELYQYIYTANTALEGLSASTTVTTPVKQQLMGEAKFVRAFCLFYLVNLFGDVPIVTGTDYRINEKVSRTPKDQVFQQIVSDLNDAQSLLNNNFVGPDVISQSEERIRPNKWAATALLARTYLFMGRWSDAEYAATSVIENKDLFDTTSLGNVFLENSKEAIWQLQPVLTGYNTFDGFYFIHTFFPPGFALYPVTMSNTLATAFEAGDNRKTSWVGNFTFIGKTYYFPYKYKKTPLKDQTVTEYLMVLRLAEQYLIRAEARAEQNNFSGARDDLNLIRTRAGLPAVALTSQASLLSAIQRERQVELFTEWGHRWLDLKRTGTVDSVMKIATAQKGGAWNINQQLYPISTLELQRDGNLTQNPGY